MKLRRIVERWILVSGALIALFVVTTTLQAIWPPLAWAVPLLAAAMLVVLVSRALWGGYASGRR